MTTIRSLSNGDGHSNKKRKKAVGLDQQNNNFALDHAFGTFFSRCCMTDMKLPNFTCPLYGAGEHNIKTFFSFLSF